MALWKANSENTIAMADGKIMIFKFDKLFGKNKIKIYNKFFIQKGSYEKQLVTITKYINFYLDKYDTDKELGMAYFKLKYALDVENRFNADNMQAFINLIYEIMFTDTMIEKICYMVEENYLDDIENNSGGKYNGKENKHLESLEFTNKHIKILLRISFGMKIMSPILFHYLAINTIKLDKESMVIYQFYEKLFDIFGEDVNIYNKLFVYVKAKVLESKSHNERIYEQRDIMGVDVYSVINLFVKKVLISENMVKYLFNEVYIEKEKKYKESVIGFNKTIIKFQLNYFLKDQYAKNLAEVTNTKDVDGLSGIDKLEMNIQKMDEGIIVLSDTNVSTSIRNISRMLNVDIDPLELAYYREHHKPHKLQIELVNSFYSKYMGGYRDLNLVSLEEYLKLLLLLKKRLLLESGYSNKDTEFVVSAKLPYILTGNVGEKINTRIIRNNKFVSKIEENYMYNDIINNKYKYLHQIKPNYILSLLSTIINTQFTYVCYEDKSILGKPIEYSEDKISDELLFFLRSL